MGGMGGMGGMPPGMMGGMPGMGGGAGGMGGMDMEGEFWECTLFDIDTRRCLLYLIHLFICCCRCSSVSSYFCIINSSGKFFKFGINMLTD